MKDCSSVTGSAAGARILALLFHLDFPNYPVTAHVSVQVDQIEREFRDLFPCNRDSALSGKVRLWIKERVW